MSRVQPLVHQPWAPAGAARDLRGADAPLAFAEPAPDLTLAGVRGTGSRWPDLIVAAIMAEIALWGGWQIVRQVSRELKAPQPASVAAD